MKQEFITKENNQQLLLFFAGWGMDSAPFAGYRPANSDLMICYDYSDITFDTSQIIGYNRINVVAWSLGVWAAARALSATSLNIDRKIAINGTMYPVDNDRGIVPEIFNGTLNGLCESTLVKFRRRMCGGVSGYKEFMLHGPQRSVDSLRIELRNIGEMYTDSLPIEFRWDDAVIGESDAIFPAASQRMAWSETSANVNIINAPHYNNYIFKRYLEDIWTND